jgi:hypothetical protein
MNSPNRIAPSSPSTEFPPRLVTPELLVGCCYGVVMLPASQLPDFYRGYAWMARTALVFAIPFSLVLNAIELIL